MKQFLHKAKPSLSSVPSPAPNQTRSQTSPLVPTQDRPSRISSPTPQDVLRYRYHHGTNLGSIFVLEKWLTPSMFPPEGPGDSELSAASSSLQQHGLSPTKARWEAHWAAAVSDADFAWLATIAKCTSIRVPVGYWTLGEEFCAGTPFEGGMLGSLYQGAWGAVKRLVGRAREWGIGVLIDFHALPGGANRDAHSGMGSGKAEFWGKRQFKDLSLKCIRFMVMECKGLEGVIGIQVVNEAVWDAEGMYEWYEEALRAIEEIDGSLPVYISDGWNLERALKWTSSRREVKNPIVVDTHKYYTFSDKDRSQTPTEIISRISNELRELDGKEGSISDRGEAQVIIGEYSCVLDGRTWARVGAEEKENYVKQFGLTQGSKWQQRAGGAYFWTFKMDWMDGGEWGFVEQVKKGNTVPPPSLLLSREEVHRRTATAIQQREQLAKDERASHENYWSRTCPRQHFQHERYSQGWEVGFSDAVSFFVMRVDGGLGGKAGDGGDRIGCLELWVKKRLLESGQGGPFVWEWEHGFRAGIGGFSRLVGI